MTPDTASQSLPRGWRQAACSCRDSADVASAKFRGLGLGLRVFIHVRAFRAFRAPGTLGLQGLWGSRDFGVERFQSRSHQASTVT